MAQAQQAAPVERPPFHPGDRLTREEFERIWDCYPEIKKAELIDGQVYYEVSVSSRHGEPHGMLTGWAAVYAAAHPDLQMMPESTIRLEGDNDLQPDVMLRRRDKGSSLISQDWHVHGPPELAVEVAASSASYDLHVKKEVYRRTGVQEYLVWQVHEKRVDWWELRDGQFVTIEPDEHGVIESRVFPGLRLNVLALLEGDLAAVLAAVMPSA